MEWTAARPFVVFWVRTTTERVKGNWERKREVGCAAQNCLAVGVSGGLSIESNPILFCSLVLASGSRAEQALTARQSIAVYVHPWLTCSEVHDRKLF